MFGHRDSSPTRPQGTSRLLNPALCGTLAALGFASAASADTVNLNYAGQGYGRVVRASLGNQSWDVFAGRLSHTTSGANGQMAGTPQSIVTFCVDILQSHTTGPSTYNTSSVATLSGNTGLTNLGFAKQQAIYDVYQAANHLQFTAGQDCAAAFQVALWEIVYDYNPNLPNHGLNAASGNFHVTTPGQNVLSPTITGAVQYLLSAVGIGAGAHGLIGLQSNPYQDQLFVSEAIVPVPSAAWLGMSGLGLMAIVARRRRS